MIITIGMKGEASTLVKKEDTAQAVGSGSLLVFSTPCMIALMEKAACEAIKGAVPEDKSSVGIALSIRHLSATPVGSSVRAEAEVTAVEGNVISFQVSAYDTHGKIGEGTHKRALITTEVFLEKTYAKL